MMQTTAVCEKCGKVFSKKFGLKRHINTAHEKVKTYSCKFCKKNFLRSDMVKRHIITTHTDGPSKEAIKCELCDKWLKNDTSLKKHLMTHQPGSRSLKKKQHKKKGNYQCNDCSTIFLYRQNLIRHIQMKHLSPQLLECEKCGVIYKSKYSLIAHIRDVHESKEKMTCDKCCKHFWNKLSMEKHIKNCSRLPKVTKVAPSIICVKCELAFPRYYLLLKHYDEKHGVMLKYENKEFTSYDEFLNWKRELEFSTIAGYHSCSGVNETSTTRIRKFRCHRSGKYRSHCENNARIRRLKKKGSKKLNGVCPAEMTVKENKLDGKCVVSFQTTHVGHEIGTQSELSHIYLDKTKRLDLAAKIADRIPLTVIMENENESLIKGNQDNRKRTITAKDLYNIKLHYAPDLTSQKKVPDDISTFLEQNKDSILYFTNDNSEVCTTTLKVFTFPFNPDKFVLVFMNAEQKKNIEELAENRVISIQVTQVLSNPEKFNLHTVMVLNLNQEGLPVAFLLTNREDDAITTCFLECIKAEVGELKVKTLISGMRTTYFKSWLKVMPMPQYSLYCTNQVTQEWNRQCKKIPLQKRDQFRANLDKLHKELDENRFRIMLDDFVFQTDPDYREFLEFFKANFLNNTEHWAYCYRKFAEIDTNTDLHFKNILFQGKKVKTIASFLDTMKNYLSYVHREEELKKINGYTPLKLELLKSRHVTAIEQLNDFTIYYLDEPGTWQVISPDNIYTVWKQTPQCQSDCLLKCVACNNVCLHEYRCSCMDHSVMYNMCEHIHTVSTIFKVERTEIVVPDTFATVTTLPATIKVSNSVSPDHFVEDDSTQHHLTKAEILEELRQKFKTIEQSIENLATNPSHWISVKEILDTIPAKINNVSMNY